MLKFEFKIYIPTDISCCATCPPNMAANRPATDSPATFAAKPT